MAGGTAFSKVGPFLEIGLVFSGGC
ncbi:hypothetical protein MPNT_10103 [Candidatus Methylacidithermus pantelleriae]|uniref:Uncharacterized protein n=1 Tax=Candidatus Methylacidithermus pantelleriae TaxID=2744239 RepID=A0A8J2FMZ9_9BACT|nr:hypothetical protein MPNT_10103 [Candidatus Methylacidithermus pantelleriae]